MEKIFIKNRHGLKVVVQIEKPENPIGLTFMAHGLGGFKEQPHIRAFAQSFLDNNYTVVSFDTTNSFGESEGDLRQATTTNYHEDLEDVIAWAPKQAWYQEPFFLCGHSQGSMSSVLYAEKHPEKVKALAPISVTISGRLYFETFASKPEVLADWEKTGWRTYTGYSSGLEKTISWEYMSDMLKYDLLDGADKLTMPVLLVTGEFDDGCPPRHQEILFKALPGPKELHIIPGAPHTFRTPEDMKAVADIIDKWLKTLK